MAGMDIHNSTAQNNFRVVYHTGTETPLDLEQLKALGIRANTDTDGKTGWLPFTHEVAIGFTREEDYIGRETDQFERYVKEALKDLYGKDVPCRISDVLSVRGEDRLMESFMAFGHKVLGTPDFTQSDPRGAGSHYDTLLFQMDSEDDIMWGDAGIANFFINKEDLKRLDFSDVLYTWDCY